MLKQIEHYDSRGNHGIVKSGGIQWMKAGKGIVHDEAFPMELQRDGGVLQGFQFWINLPAKNKTEEPAYKPVQADEIPEFKLEKDGGKLRVLIGNYGEHKAAIPIYSKQFISGEGKVNDVVTTEPELFVFGKEGSGIHLVNKGASQMEVILFGGEAYLEPVSAGGPFVMNTQEELHQAYKDYRAGLYGSITYNN